ncbi:MAG: 50S ribosome-binding GTPase, partial [Clostridiales bacterium]|nr:50S ribosome-binding GTPase [Clostridiales bacterium]
QLLAAIRASGKNAIKIDANTPAGARALRGAMTELVKEKTERLKEKGSNKPVRFLIAGVPNTGKSTLINRLAGANKAITGNKAGVTRGKQWVKCGSFELMDSPGTMPPACEDQRLARRLAYIGSINDDILEMDEIALCLLEELSATYLSRLTERYGITGGEPLEMLNRVCVRRGFLLRGNNDYDYERGERAVIDDFRKGKLGCITLDTKDDLVAVGLAR